MHVSDVNVKAPGDKKVLKDESWDGCFNTVVVRKLVHDREPSWPSVISVDFLRFFKLLRLLQKFWVFFSKKCVQ